MSIQSVIDTAQAIEVSRPAVVATSMSRSGRMFTGTRNWAKPWRFTVTPKPYWTAATAQKDSLKTEIAGVQPRASAARHPFSAGAPDTAQTARHAVGGRGHHPRPD